jgi:vitamin B12 transporter
MFPAVPLRSDRSRSWIAIVLAALAGAVPVRLPAQGAVNLPAVTVYSPRVANQSPAVTFAMPVSALRYEPRVDIQSRNLAESQSDVTIRGGIFENTGIQVGAVSLGDPQTGHYHAELPLAPGMLGPVQVITGSEVALAAANGTAGSLAYAWRPITSGGSAAVGMGENRLRRAEFLHGQRGPKTGSFGEAGIEVALGYSESDGPIRYGDHEFSRACFRGQLLGEGRQTDLVFAYQGKRFGWPNLYTPFGSNEFENLQTRLLLLNQRWDAANGEFWEWGVFERRNKDDYAFNRFAPVGPVHPFQHTTWVRGAGLRGRQIVGGISWDLRAELNADRIESTSLTAGRFNRRTLGKLALLGGHSWDATAGGEQHVRAGLVYDDSNRDAAAISPVVEVARQFQGRQVSRLHLAFSRATQVPTYTALNSSASSGLFRGNPDLGRSTSDNVEVGLLAAVWNWSLQAAVFHRRDRRLVDWTFRRGTTARVANAMDVGVTGVEVVARRHWAVGEVTFGYTALGKDADYRGAPVDASFYALNYARHRLTAALTLRPARGVELRVDNSLRLQAENALRTLGGDRAIHTMVGLFWRPPGSGRIEISCRVENLWDDDFQEVPAVPAAPRQVSLSAGTTW